jgi:putative ABC transport system permease protein
MRSAIAQIAQDMRYATRGFAARPGFTIAVLLILALGVGASTAIFTLVRGVILKPLSYKEPERLVHIYENHPKGTRFTWGEGAHFIIVRGATLHAWRTQSRSFESIEAIRWRTRTLTGDERADSVWGNDVSSGFFRTCGVTPILGRTLTPDDYVPGIPRAVVISFRLWRTRYGADPSIVGRRIHIDGSAVPVVGVMPQAFFPADPPPPDLWLPYSAASGEDDDRVTWRFTTLARLKPGVTFEQAHADMDLISARLAASYPEDYTNMDAVLVPVMGEVIGTYPRLLYTLLAAVGLVLLIGCVNVANLTLARANERSHEFSVRSALGASRSRLVRQVLAESLLLSGIGGLLGAALALASLPIALALLPPDNGLPRLDEVGIDWVVLAFTMAASLSSGVLFGLAPALRVSRWRLSETLQEAGRGSGSSRRMRRVGDALVVAEIALSLLLLAGAGLLIRSFLRLRAVDPGIATAQVLALQLTVPTHHYGDYEVGGPNRRRAALYGELARATSAVPGVEAAAVTGLLPLRHGPNPWGITIEGRGPAVPEAGGAAGRLREGLFHHGSVSVERVTPDYFRTLGIRLLRGRLIDERDVSGSPLVTIVNETFVRKFFPDEDPVGRRITADMTSYFPKLTIVGVVADNKMHGLDRELYPLLYWPMTQFPSINAWLIVRAHGRPDVLAAAVRSRVIRIEPDLAITDVTTMARVVEESIWRPRVTTILLGAFSLAALVLAAAGVYSLISYNVSQRTREVGLRITLGAAPHTIVRMVVGHGAVLATLGIMIGVAASLGLRSVLASQLFGISPSDPATLGSVSLVLVLVALAASAVPAWRAMRIEPATALRQR